MMPLIHCLWLLAAALYGTIAALSAMMGRTTHAILNLAAAIACIVAFGLA